VTAKTLIVGSRGSRLALRQTELVVAELARRHPSVRFRVERIRTAGDRQSGVSLSRIGGQGVFVKEIESALLAGKIDLAVHSLKDMTTDVPAGLAIAAVPPREDVRDALVSRGGLKLADLSAGARVGTGSPRRAVQLKALRPDLDVIDIRGNIDTRVRKVEEGQADATLLSAAGLARLGWLERASEVLSVEAMLPAVGQGTLALETRADDRATRDVVEVIEDRETRLATAAEKTFLARLGGGCRVPIAALATVDGGSLRLRGLVAEADGPRILRGETSGPVETAEALGAQLAEELLKRGAAEMVAEIST
jgi:hydroxymethylbilane synthase